jgi:hypothetical protein
MVKGPATFAEIYPEFLEFIDGSVLIAPTRRSTSASSPPRPNAPPAPPKNAVLDSLVLFATGAPTSSPTS